MQTRPISPGVRGGACGCCCGGCVAYAAPMRGWLAGGPNGEWAVGPCGGGERPCELHGDMLGCTKFLRRACACCSSYSSALLFTMRSRPFMTTSTVCEFWCWFRPRERELAPYPPLEPYPPLASPPLPMAFQSLPPYPLPPPLLAFLYEAE